MPIVKRLFLWLLAGFMVFAGVMHFVNPKMYTDIMPPGIPWHLELVYLSGVFEILIGLGLLVPKLRRIAARGLIVLLIAVFPANIQMALDAEKTPFPAWALYLRLPLQLPLIWWAYWFTIPDRKES